jgi:hypothetical protein
MPLAIFVYHNNVVLLWYYCAVTGESKKIVFTSGQRKKSRVAEPRVIFGVPTSENNF